MTDQLKLEWLKFRKSSVFQSLTFLYLLLLPLQLTAVQSMKLSIPGLSANVLVQNPTVWSFLAYSGSWLVYFFWGFFAIYFFSSEFSQKTFRQNIISGLTRGQLYSGKVGALIILAMASTLYYAMWAFIFGWANQPSSGESTGMTDRFYMIPRYFLMNLGYMSIGVVAATLSRKTAMSVFLYFTYTIFLEPAVRWLIHRRIIDDRTMLFYPANSFEDLTPMPLSDVALTKDLAEQTGVSLALQGQEATITAAIYILILLFLAWWLVKTRDL